MFFILLALALASRGDEDEGVWSQTSAALHTDYVLYCECLRTTASLGSRLINFQSQKMTAAASAIAERKTFGHLS
ncbi:hypothetical protein AT574_04860 [Phaeobacter inhibens]|nr:hypothetical protein AT574_04860 [Phaeobacter inhibens]